MLPDRERLTWKTRRAPDTSQFNHNNVPLRSKTTAAPR